MEHTIRTVLFGPDVEDDVAVDVALELADVDVLDVLDVLDACLAKFVAGRIDDVKVRRERIDLLVGVGGAVEGLGLEEAP
jgi:hypothetical protein